MPECQSKQHGAGVLPSPGSFQLLDLADDQILFDASQTINEQRPIEMIHLVLKRAREKLASIDRALVGRSVETSDDRSCRPHDRGIEARDTEASLFFELHAFARDKNRIDH